MKKRILSIAWALVSLTSTYAQNINESVINATLNGIPDGIEMEVTLASTHRDEKAIATGIVKNGKLSITVPVTEARYIGIGQKGSFPTFYLMTQGGENVTVSLDAKPFSYGKNKGYDGTNIKIQGSAMNDVYNEKIDAVKKVLDKKYVEYHQQFKKLQEQLNEAYQAKDQAKRKALMESEEGKAFAAAENEFFDTVSASYNKIYADNKDSWWGPFAMLNTMSYFSNENKVQWAMFSDAAKNSFYGKILGEQINPKGFTGETLPQFDLQQADGSKVAMASAVKGKKYYLVDFWASWCNPCRKEIPNLKHLYELYKDKGFQIVSVSIDKNENAWKKALNEEKLPWPNGLDRAGIADSYKVRFIPAIFLVDGATGKCIAENIRGEELATKLAELFK